MNTRYLITDFMKRLAPCAFGLLLIGAAPVAMAATSQYEQDVARCRSGESGQDVQACLKEARAARAAAGKLGVAIGERGCLLGLGRGLLGSVGAFLEIDRCAAPPLRMR